MEKAIRRLNIIAQLGVFQNDAHVFKRADSEDYTVLVIRGAALCEEVLRFYLENQGLQIEKGFVYYWEENIRKKSALLCYCEISNEIPEICRLYASTILAYYDKIAEEKPIEYGDALYFVEAVYYLGLWFEKDTEFINRDVDWSKLMTLVDMPAMRVARNPATLINGESPAYMNHYNNLKMNSEQILERLKKVHSYLAFAKAVFTESDSYKTIDIGAIEQIEKISEDYRASDEEDAESIFEKSIVVVMSAPERAAALEAEQERLIQYLGREVWDKLLPESKKLLFSARCTYKTLARFGNYADYTPVCIAYGKVFECEMKYRLFTRFIEYQKKEYKTHYEKYHTAVLHKHQSILKSKAFTLGRVPYIFCTKTTERDAANEQVKRNEKVLMDYAEKELFKQKYSSDDICEFIKEWSEISEYIRKKYRNISAHSGSKISFELATECMDYVLRERKALRCILEKLVF